MFTESQRKRFNAEERTQPGEERMSEPAEHDSKCYACGGSVDAKGMATGGMVDSERSDDDDDGAVNAEGETSQSAFGDEYAERARVRSFSRAVRGR